MNQWGTRVAAALLVAGIAQAGTVEAQPAASATAASAKELSGLLSSGATGAGARFIAAEDPADPSRFVAAMLLPDLQLLMVSAHYKAPVLLRERVLTKKYRDAYQDLQAASVAEGKIVIEDLLANGLAIKPVKNQAADAATIGGKTITFDGQWRKAKVSEADYMSAYTTAEKEYTRLLPLLIAQAKVK
jgi:hypothetical protein